MAKRLIVALVALALGAACCVRLDAGSTSNDRSAAARQFIQLLADGRFAEARARFDDTMKQAMSDEQLGQLWQLLTFQHGAFKRIAAAQAGRKSGYDVVNVTCEFARGTQVLRVVFDADGRIGGLWMGAATEAKSKPPPYARRDRFDEQPIAVNKGGKWELPGTLAIPKGKGPFPAVVLVHGSGPQDRDETIGPNKPFRDLAWGLASKGIAVLRYEKRTKVYGARMAGVMDKFTVKEETIDDALAAVELLRKADGIDHRRIFVIGHSLGGVLIPRIGKADPKIAGLISMAGTPRPFEDVILEQVTYIASLKRSLTANDRKEIEKLKQQVRNAKSPTLSLKTPASSLPLGGLGGVSSAYWIDIRDHNPIQTAKSIKQPMMFLQGGRDYQATPADLDIWKKALSSRKNVTFKLYPDLNHLFMKGVGKATPAEYEKPGFVSEVVVNDIAGWVKAH